MVLVVKSPPANAGDIRGMGSILGLERSPGGGHGNLLQYSCLENPKDRGAWLAKVHRVVKNQARLSTHARLHLVVQWLRIPLAKQGTWVQLLVRELRSHVLWSN